MINELMIFEGHEVEVLELNGNVLFNPYHVGICLGMADGTVKDHMSKMNKKQAVLLKNSDVGLTNFRKLNNAGEKFLTESGVYKLVFKSRKPDADVFTDWIADDVLPTIRKNGMYESPKIEAESSNKKIRIMEMNARVRVAQTYLKIAEVSTLSPTYKNVLASKASEALAGEEVIPLPKIEQRKRYTATQIGDMFGVSANKIGRTANEHNLKTDEYGELIRDKSKYSAREVDTWVWFDTIIPVLRQLLSEKENKLQGEK